MSGPRTSSALLALALAGCQPELDTDVSTVDRPRVLGVFAEPPEARPGAPVAYELLAAGPTGRELAPAAHWTTCTTPRAGVDTGSVNPACYWAPGPPFEEQSGARATAALPLDACARFGPDPPPGDARPRDPDATGGFYQPIVVFGPAEPVLHLQRIVCNPRSAPADLARELAAAYVPNRNPSPPRLELSDGAPVPPAVRPDATLALAARWAPSDAESYAWLDREALAIETRHEALAVSWFATAGGFDVERSELLEGDPAAQVENTWTAPVGAGPVTLWVVLRDSRGGASFLELSLQVEP